MNDHEGATQPARDKDAQQDSPRRSDRAAGGQRERDRGRRGRDQNQPRRPEQQLPMDELRELLTLFTEHSLTHFELERGEFRVQVGRHAAAEPSNATYASAADTQSGPGIDATRQPTTADATATSGASEIAAEVAPAEEEQLQVITSPIVGTFYRAASTTAEPFVRLGSHVGPDSIVCIIEAMKLMNEIQAETSGEIAKVYVENGQPVEFGQALFGVKK